MCIPIQKSQCNSSDYKTSKGKNGCDWNLKYAKFVAETNENFSVLSLSLSLSLKEDRNNLSYVIVYRVKLKKRRGGGERERETCFLDQ